jgi:hypothetical protein
MINGIKEEIVEILVEEHSMENFLKELLPTILPAGYRLDINCFIRVHEFRNPDNCGAFEELKKIIPGFQKVYASIEIPKHLSIECNKSPSFRNLVTGIQNFLN